MRMISQGAMLGCLHRNMDNKALCVLRCAWVNTTFFGQTRLLTLFLTAALLNSLNSINLVLLDPGTLTQLFPP